MSQLPFDDEDYYFQISEELESDKEFILIIYDIVDNKRRVRFAKMMSGFGFRVQKSAFEAVISHSLYTKLLREIEKFVTKEDSIRIYKIVGQGQVTVLGKQENVQQGDCIVI